MKKIFFIASLGTFLLTSCMVNTPEYVAELNNTTPTVTEEPATQTDEPDAVQEDDPAEEEPTPEPAEEDTPAAEPEEPEEEEPAEMLRTAERAIPEEAIPEVEEPEPIETTEPEEAAEEPEEIPTATKPVSVDWTAFYKRVEQKGREKYDGKLPWRYLAKDANIKVATWMMDARSCTMCNPSKEDIRKVAEVLEVSYEWLLYGED